MLGPQPPRSADLCSHAHPDTLRSVAATTTEMWWAIALATTQASFASTAHGLALWSRMLRAPTDSWPLTTMLLTAAPFAGDHSSGDSSSVSSDPMATSGTSAQEATATAPSADPQAEEATAFASYRSSGGHAAAQVITQR